MGGNLASISTSLSCTHAMHHVKLVDATQMLRTTVSSWNLSERGMFLCKDPGIDASWHIPEKLACDLYPSCPCGMQSYTRTVQEITLIYPQLHPPELNAQASNRVCNALALFQCVASHQETRELFLQAQIPLFLYPFLNTTSKTRPFEYLRLTALGVIGALVKQDDSTVCLTAENWSKIH